MSRPVARSIYTLRHACVARRFSCLRAATIHMPHASKTTTRGLRNGNMLNEPIHDAWRLPHGTAYSTSTSVSTENSKVVLNPRYDDDGNPFVIKISPRAASLFWPLPQRKESAGCIHITFSAVFLQPSEEDGIHDLCSLQCSASAKSQTHHRRHQHLRSPKAPTKTHTIISASPSLAVAATAFSISCH